VSFQDCSDYVDQAADAAGTRWSRLGLDIQLENYGGRKSKRDYEQIALSSDGMTAAFGSRFAINSEARDGHVIVLAYDPNSNSWARKGKPLLSYDWESYHGSNVVMSGDGTW